MTQQIIFYSWQSWTDGGTNRNFIEDCLQRAIKEIRKDDSLKLDPVIDRDTQGVPGAADIANTILEKIAESDVFVADVSFVHDHSTQRRTPNPNVLVELGYALGKLGKDKVICVLNLASGRIEDLPFDIRGRTVATYELPSKDFFQDEAKWLEARAEQRKQFVGPLKSALVAILAATDPVLNQFVSQVVERLILTIVFGNEVEDRPIKPGSDVMQAILKNTAEELRVMACQEQASRLNVTDRLSEVATALEEAVHFPRYSGRENHEQYVGLVKKAVALATSLKQEWVNSRSLDRQSLTAVHRRLYEMRRQLDDLAARTPTLVLRPGGMDEVQEMANALGLDLCRLGQFDLDSIQSGLAERLSEVGRNLHLVGVTLSYVRQRPVMLTNNLSQFAKEFGAIVDGLPSVR